MISTDKAVGVLVKERESLLHLIKTFSIRLKNPDGMNPSYLKEVIAESKTTVTSIEESIRILKRRNLIIKPSKIK